MDGKAVTPLRKPAPAARCTEAVRHTPGSMFAIGAGGEHYALLCASCGRAYRLLAELEPIVRRYRARTCA